MPPGERRRARRSARLRHPGRPHRREPAGRLRRRARRHRGVRLRRHPRAPRAERPRSRRARRRPGLRPVPPPGFGDVSGCAHPVAAYPHDPRRRHRRRSGASGDGRGARIPRHAGAGVGADRGHLAAGDPHGGTAARPRLPRTGGRKHRRAQRQPRARRPRRAALPDRTVQPVGRDRGVRALRPAPGHRGIIDIEHQLRPATRLRLFEIAAGIADKYIPEADRQP